MNAADDALLEVLIEEARRTAPAQFAASHPELFFLVQQQATDAQPRQFETEVPIRRGGTPMPARHLERTVVPVVKSSRSPYQGRISIGRARNCDVVLRDPSVSKLHAYVAVSPDGSYTIVDVGSQNGTRLGGELLTSNIPAPLRPGDLLTFGIVPATTLDASSAHAALLRIAMTTSR